MIPLLADPNDVLADLGYDSTMVNIMAATRSALRMATADLSAALHTDFTHAAAQDVYYVRDVTRRHSNGSVITEFRLSQAFVDASQPFVAVFAPSSVALAQQGQPVDVSTAISVDLQKGVAVDVLNDYGRMWVQLNYTKGFPLSTADATSYDLTVVPDWLQECASLLAKITLQSNPSLEDPAIKLDTRLLQGQLNTTLKPHLRYTPAAQIPTLSAIFGPTLQATATVAEAPGAVDAYFDNSGAASTPSPQGTGAATTTEAPMIVTLSATGRTQATAVLVNGNVVVVTAADAGNTGVKLNPAWPLCQIRNRTGMSVLVWPPAGDQLDGEDAVNTPVLLANGADASFARIAASNQPVWYY